MSFQSQRGRSAYGAAVFAVAAIFLTMAPGLALGGISSTVFSLEATNNEGTATLTVPFSSGSWSAATSTYTWSLGAPVDLFDGGSYVATLNDASVEIVLDTVVDMSMHVDVVAGDSHTDFIFDSALVDFPAVASGDGFAGSSASATVWDNYANGAFLIGIGTPGIGAFQSFYNGYAPGGTMFTHLLSVVSASGGGFGTGSQSDPPVGMRPISGSYDDASIHTGFTLTAGDRAAGNTTYTIVPEPTGLARLVIGVTIALSKRRS